MNRYLSLIPAIAVALLQSCAIDLDINQDELNNNSEYDLPKNDNIELITEVYAGSPSTKTVRLSDGSIHWRPGDKICVFPYGSSNPGEFTATAEEEASWTAFSGEMTINTVIGGTDDSGEAKWNYAVYPYDSSDTRSDATMTVTVPSEQQAVGGSFDPASFVSVARADNFYFKFYNLCGGIKFSLINEGVLTISVKGNNDEYIAGKVKVSIDEDGYPRASEIIEGQKEIVLTAPTSSGFEPGEWYYISALPTIFSQGLTFTLKTADSTGERVITSSREIMRSDFGRLTELDADVEFEQAEDFAQAFFGSDRHGDTAIVGSLLNRMKKNGADISRAVFCGDMVGGTGISAPPYNSSTIQNEVLAYYPNADVSILYADHDAGVVDDANIVYKVPTPIDCGCYYVYIVPEKYMEKNDSSDTKDIDDTKAENGSSDFVTWANSSAVDPSKPIFVCSHLPLVYNRRDNHGAWYWFKALNTVATGSENGKSAIRNVIFFCGHNHSYDENEYSNLVGTTMDIQGSSSKNHSKETIYFTNWVAGYLGGTLNPRGHATLVTIDTEKIKLERYDANGLAVINGEGDGVNTTTITRLK